jgi:peptidyl-tRNA hydrolase, PTH1 family
VKVVVGLGNPGRQYAETRHNIGWMVIDRLAERARWSDRPARGSAAAIVSGRYRGLDVALVKPHTFMNLSGSAVRKALIRFRAPLEDLLVVVDDFALPFGRLRFREAGSSGGHNGLESIIDELNSDRFARLRVGIGEPGGTAIDHVLSRFSKEERRSLEEILDAATDAVEDWARLGTNKAATRWNAWALGEEGAAADGKAAPGGAAGRSPAGPENGTRKQEGAGAEGSGEAPAEGTGLLGAQRAPEASNSPPEEGAVGPDGIRRTRSGWRKILGLSKDEGR